MSLYPRPVEELIDHFARLPGIGRKGAARLVFHLLGKSDDDVRAFAEAMVAARVNTVFCRECQNLSEEELCPLCSGSGRDRATLCVVAEPRDVAAVERCREYKGLYHVLHGVISPTKQKSPDDIRLKELLERVGGGGFLEVILATNPDTDGDTTALYIARMLRPYEVKVTRLAYGLPMGGHVEYADELTILRALDGRREV
ncbi:MAG: recombination mediator RecR [Oscillospiraceae bacterium]|jgi:recombination protein RecR|nr:recombination mediator RecR [Oscillospiraceae bacterium]